MERGRRGVWLREGGEGCGDREERGVVERGRRGVLVERGRRGVLVERGRRGVLVERGVWLR